MEGWYTFEELQVTGGGSVTASSSSVLLLSLELSDAKVYGLEVRAPLGTASHFCEVVVLRLSAIATVVLKLIDALLRSDAVLRVDILLKVDTLLRGDAFLMGWEVAEGGSVTQVERLE